MSRTRLNLLEPSPTPTQTRLRNSRLKHAKPLGILALRMMDEALRTYLAEIGRKGGQAKSPAKSKAARQNARKRWQKVKPSKAPQNPVVTPQRNALCPCKSGFKWKKCCGRAKASRS
ncbi:MAG: SEC-C metal-binding domain-containing protein [Chthoniobacteraceae bacterium]